MSDEELEKLARKYKLRGFLEETYILTNDRKTDTDLVINRRSVINQLLQRESRNVTFLSVIFAAVSVLGAIISLFANFLRK